MGVKNASSFATVEFYEGTGSGAVVSCVTTICPRSPTASGLFRGVAGKLLRLVFTLGTVYFRHEFGCLGAGLQ